MSANVPPGGQITGRRLATVLGNWRHGGVRRGATDLAAAVELNVLDGRLPPGTRLPAERELADALDVSRTLVVSALDRLREDGLVASRRGAGSWITTPSTTRTAAPGEDSDAIDLARAVSPPIAGLTAALDGARRELCAQLTAPCPDLGLPDLRDRIAAGYTARGLPTTRAQVMITNGAHHAFVVALRMLTGPGDRVLVEQPTYANTLDTIRATHAIPVPVSVDLDTGWDIAGVEAVIRQAGPRLAYVNVDFQNPTGLRLDTEGRQRLGAAFSRGRTPVVVDETLVELDLDGAPVDGPPPLAAFAPEWAITVGSASKSHWDGLRIGWIRASEELIGRLEPARLTIDLGSPVLDQLVLAELLGAADSAARQRRSDLRDRRDVLVEAVTRQFPEWTFRVPSGGLSLWCRLPEPISTRLAVLAGNHGVSIAPGSRFGAYGGLERWIRLPYAQPADRLTEAVRRLGVAAASVDGGRSSAATVRVA